METKPWYKSTTVIAGIVTALASIWNLVAVPHGLPAIPEWLTLGTGAGAVYGRIKAKTKIG